ncbi:MAG: hypothetical protein J5574_06930 [Lachnospiraceae bacterium]|nr:hypothetical protein [Lachnospiraceae bacterium]
MMDNGKLPVSGNEVRSGEQFELPHYAPYSDLTKDYEMLGKLRDFERNIEGLCRSFIRNTSPDHNNGKYFDAVIEKYCDEAVKDIDLQRREHIQLFRQSVAGYQKGISVKIEAKLQMVLDAIEENDKELAKCKKVYFKGTSMED